MRYFTRFNMLSTCAIIVVGVCGTRLACTYAQQPNKALPARAAAPASSGFTGAPGLDAQAAPVLTRKARGSSARATNLRAADTADRTHTSFLLMSRDGEAVEYTATRLYVYEMTPGGAKPKRLDAAGAAAVTAEMYGSDGDMMGSAGSEYGGMMPGEGYPGGGYAAGPTPRLAGAPGHQGASPMHLLAYVFDELEDPAAETTELPAAKLDNLVRPQIKVVVPMSRSAELGGAIGGLYGAQPGMMPVAGMAVPGAAMESMGMGSMGGFDMGAGGGMAREKPRMQLLEEVGAADLAEPESAVSAATLKQRRAELSNIAQLVRLDIWIHDTQSQLKAERGDSESFAATEEHLKVLLAEEYDAQLVKQRTDIAKLRAKLEQLQADLERRAQAKDRVVNVQLGQFVLEAQGLLGNER